MCSLSSLRATVTLSLGVALAFAGAEPRAHAHGTRSVSVEVSELAAGQATIHVRAQLPTDILKVTVDAPCATHPTGAPAAKGRPSLAAVTTFRVECPAGLAGATLRFSGLGPIVNQAIVVYTFGDGRTGSAVVRAEEAHFVLPRVPGVYEVARSYVGLGIAHILTGYDHLLFLLLLVFCLRDVRAVFYAELAFTLSHSLSFSATALGLVHMSSAAAEACIALSLVLMALDVRTNARQPVLRGACLAFVFGLVHGLGFAGGLAEIGLPDKDVAVALIGFAGGVELGQILFLVAALLALAGAGRVNAIVRLPRLEPLTVAVIGGFATYWLAERVIAALAVAA